jgi:hypothetical protein
MTSNGEKFESMPPNYESYQFKPAGGPKFLMVKRMFASYKCVEVDKATFLSNYHSQFCNDFDWFGMVDDGKLPTSFFLRVPTPGFPGLCSSIQLFVAPPTCWLSFKGIYEYISTLKTSNASKFIPFYRLFKARQVKNYILRRKEDHDNFGDSIVLKEGEEGFLARATEGGEGTVMIMWKRRFLFSPKKPSTVGAPVAQY